MAGTVTKTEKVHAGVKKFTFAWTSSSGGAADATTAHAVTGKIVGLTTVPAGGGDQPTDDYDVQIKDDDGHDVLLGAGTDRDNTATEHVASASLAAVADSKLTLAVTGAGSTKKGTVILYVE